MTEPSPGGGHATHLLTKEVLEPHLQDLGDLFAFLWRIVVPYTSVLHTAPWRGRRVAEYGSLAAIVRRGSATGVPAIVVQYLTGGQTAFAVDVPPEAVGERAFTVMLVIDLLAQDIHPGTVGISRSAHPPAPCRAISQLRRKRWLEGRYGGGINGTGHVVPKGPLYRRILDEDETTSGDRLDTQFTSLALLAARTDHYTVCIEVVSPRDFPAGYDPADASSTRIGIAPVAEGPDDLVFESMLREERPFLDARPRDPGALAARTVEAVRAVQRADLVLLPELCVSPDAVEAVIHDLVAAAASGNAQVPRLIALGSGLSAQVSPHTARPYNECTIVDAGGRVLWKQRKLNHFRMSDGRMVECDIATAAARHHAEDVATDTVLQIRDLPHFGRVMVLICEDLEQTAPGGDTALALKPDWILTPVLDVGQSVGRWTNQRAIEIGRLTGTRVLISNSAILAVRQSNKLGVRGADLDRIGIGLCLDMSEARRMKIITMKDCTPTPVSACFD